MPNQNRYLTHLKLLGAAAVILTVMLIITVSAVLVTARGELYIYLPDDKFISDYEPQDDIFTLVPYGSNEHIGIIHSDGRSGSSFILSKEKGEQEALALIEVLPNDIVFNKNTFDFSGSRGISLTFLIYLSLMSAVFTLSFLIRCRHELFYYNTLFYGGLSLFLFVVLLNIGKHIIAIFTDPVENGMNNVVAAMRYASEDFLLITVPFMMIFAIALAISNITLIKREGKRLANILGLILSGLLFFGIMFYIVLSSLFSHGSVQQMKVYAAILEIYSVTFIYFETMLVSSVICGLFAAKRRPAYDKTHIIILGCAIADDGTPLPLLRGRIDRAIAFAKEQKEKTGKDIVFVPSGGQGSDEVISESESMGNYLVSQGISRDRIIIENKSVNTVQNMQFSLEKIKEQCEEPRIIFSTSGYHVLRSGMISKTAGLEAEGIGSRTKWYFWPNAFIREFVGLLVSKWKRHAMFVIVFIAVFISINFLLPM